MKKILTLLLCIVLAVSMLGMVSCSEVDGDTADKLAGKTPEELYEASQLKLKEAESFYVCASQEIVMTVQDESMVMNQLVESKINGDESYMKTENDLSPDLNMEVWYVDGVVYSKMMGVKAKAEISKEKFMEQYMNTDASESTLMDIPESWFEDIKFTKEGEGWVLNFVISGDKYTEVYKNIGLSGASIEGEVSHKMYFDNDGNIEKVVTSFDMMVNGVAAHCDSVSVITIGEVEITPPADADSYQSVNL